MVLDLLFLLLPISAATGWIMGYKTRQKNPDDSLRRLPKDYLVGLNYLINEQSDKAVDVFIKLLEVDSDTVETHLALGSLFRRQGEVSRATRIHQNLIARPQLDERQRMAALSELAKDYYSAGVLDRAEQIFRKLVNDSAQGWTSLQSLLDIYTQQKQWRKASEIAEKIAASGDNEIYPAMAHYYCALAEEAHSESHWEQARRFLKKALAVDKYCVRANLLLAQLELDRGYPKQAIKLLEKVKDQDPAYISEVLPLLCATYEQLKDLPGLIKALQDYFERHPSASVLLTITEYISRYSGEKDALEYLGRMIRQYPSLEGLNQLIDLYIIYAKDDSRDKLVILRELTDQLLMHRPNYRCQQCGFAYQSLYWHCPSCKHWNTIKAVHGLVGEWN